MDKEKIKKSVENFVKKTTETKHRQPRQQKNKKPEQEIVKQIFFEMKRMGFVSLIVEARAVYNHEAGRYLGSQVAPGTSDILASSPQGYFVACEVKAKGLRRTLKAHQKQFLVSVIHSGAFGCCSDSPNHFVDLYLKWTLTNRSKDLLLKDLPVLDYEKDNTPLFNED